jgi:hypothetical protein
MHAAFSVLLLLVATTLGVCAQYAPEAGTTGTTAIHKDSPLFVRWANGHTNYLPGTEVDSSWQTPAKSYGQAVQTDSFHIVCLGNGGQITLFFPLPVRDDNGADFAVFENSHSHAFLELAFVEVSSDGQNFFRFPTASLTLGVVGPYAEVYPEEIDGFASKYIRGYGTPFDLATLADNPLLDKQRVRFIRIVDIIGTGATKDSSGRPIYDPTPTTGSGGFDLDAIGVIHENSEPVQLLPAFIDGSGFHLIWQSNPGSTYRIEQSVDLYQWTGATTLNGSSTSTQTGQIHPVTTPGKCFWRISRQ